MSAQLAPNPVFQAFAPNGGFLVGGKLFTYVAGTSTPQATYVDSTQTTQNTNPIILNALGQATVWLNPTLAYKFVLQDSAGNVQWSADNINAPALTQTIIGQLLYPQTPAELAAGITPTLYYYPPGNVLRYGADATGAASSYNAFVAAIAVCTQTGLPITVPAGQFNLPTTNPPIACAFVTFQGAGVAKGSSIDAAGSVFNFTGTTTTNSAFSIGPGVSFYGIGFYYPAQVDSFTPIAFAPTIITNLTNGAVNFVYVQNCVVWNAYRFFVDADAGGSIGHVWFIDNTIYGVLTCFEFAYNAEIMTFQGNEFTFGHYLAATETGLRKFTRANGTALLMTRTDGITFNSNVIYGYQIGIYFNTVATLCQLTAITANYFDNVLFPILASGTGNVSSIAITSNTFDAFNSQLTTAAGTAVQILTSGSLVGETISIAGNIFGTTTVSLIGTNGGAIRQLTISGNTFTSWAAFQTSGTYPAININGAATSHTTTGNSFINQNGAGGVTTIGIGGTCVDAVIATNTFGACSAALTTVLNSAVVTGNISYGTTGTVSDVVSAGAVYQVNNNWDKASGNSSRPMWNVTKNASQTFAHSASNVVCTFAGVNYDMAGNWNTGTSTFTAKQAGRYRFGWQLMHDNTATAADRWTFTLAISAGAPSAQVSYKVPTPTDFNSFSGYCEMTLPVSATVQLLATQVGGTGNLVTFNQAASNYFCGSLVE